MWLNGQHLPIKGFQDYCELYLGDKLTGGPREYLRINERWEVCIAPSDGQFQQARALKPSQPDPAGFVLFTDKG